MARQKIKPDAPTDGDRLRTKYAELTRKYAGVVSTLERRMNDRVVSRFGWLGLQATGTAFALLRGQSVVLANRRWGQLAVGNGSWRRRSTSNTKSYPDLNALALAEAKAAAAAESGTVIEAFDRPAPDPSLDLRFELAGPGETPTALPLATAVTQRLRREQELMRKIGRAHV